MELKKFVRECAEALQEEAGRDYAYMEDDEPFGAVVSTNDGYVDLHYNKGEVEVEIIHDDEMRPRHGVEDTNLEKFLEDALADCVDWQVVEEEWKENSMDEWQWNGFDSEADFWRWKEGR